MTTNEREFETLSAVMDGEADELELRRMLDATSSDAELRAKWRRQQMVRELLQTRRISQPDIEVSAAVKGDVDWRKQCAQKSALEYGCGCFCDHGCCAGRSATVGAPK